MAVNVGTAIAYLTLDHSRFSSGLRGAGQEFRDFLNSTSTGTDRINELGNVMTSVGSKLTKSITVPVVGAGVAASKAAIGFESAFTGVRKTVDATEEQFTELRQSIRDMAKSMPESATEIAGVAEAAGQLGIKTESISGFTKAMVMLGDSTNLSSQDAATALARLANITQMPQENFERLGSSIVALGNNLATTESEITEMSLRLAGAGHQVGLSEADITGLAGALSSVGIEAEMGGSAFSKVMIKMQLAAETGKQANEEIAKIGKSARELQLLADADSKGFTELAQSFGYTSDELTALVQKSVDLDAFAQVTGKTADEFTQAFKEDAVGSIGEFIKGLQTCEDRGTSAIAVLDSMGIKEVRLRDTLLRAAGAGNTFAEAVKLSNDAWNKNTALSKEANTRYETTESKLKILKNKFIDIGITLGDSLLPTIQSFADKIGGIVDWFSNLDEGTRNTIVKFVLLAAAMGPVLTIGGKLVSGTSKIIKLATKIPGIGSRIARVFGTTASATTTLASGVAEAAAETTGMISPVSMAMSGVRDFGLIAKAASFLLNPWTLGIAAATGTAIVLGKKLSKEVVPEVDLFADHVDRSASGIVEGTTKISEATKKAVGAFMDLSDSNEKQLIDLKLNGEKLTSEMCTNLVNNYKSMGEQVKTEMNKQTSEQIELLAQYYDNNKELLETSQAESGEIQISSKEETLQRLREYNQKETKALEDKEARIKEILTNASNENRELTEDEYNELDTLQNEMKEKAINTLSDTEKEAAIILGRINDNSKRMTAETASDIVKQLEETRQKTIDNANVEYEEKIKIINNMDDDVLRESGLTKEQLIKDAEEQRDKIIESADRTKEEGLAKLEEKFKDLRNTVDTETGKIMTFWERLCKKLEITPEAKVKMREEWNTPGSAGGSASNGAGMKPSGYASGTRSAMSGYHLVGENGPELVKFKGGETVYNDADTKKILNEMYSKDTKQEAINKYSLDIDYNKLAFSISRAMKKDKSSNSNNRNNSISVIIDGRETMRALAPYQDEFEEYNNNNPSFVR